MMRFWFVILLYAANALLCPEPFPVVLTLPLCLLIAWNMARIQEARAGARDVFWFCMYLFFVISPCQTIRGTTIGGEEGVTLIEYSTRQYIVAMAIVFAFTAVFSIGGLFTRKQYVPAPDRIFRPLGGVAVTGVMVASFVVYVVLGGGLANVMAPRYEKAEDDISVYAFAALSFLAISAAFVAAGLRHDKRWDIRYLPAFVLACGLLMIAQGPFNAPRFGMLAAWMPMGLVLINGKIRASTFYFAALVSIVVVFPVLNVSSRFGYQELFVSDELFSVNNFSKIPFIDVFDTLVHAVFMMENMSYFYGEKLLAIFLFFVPRAFWAGKPIVGGLDVGYNIYYSGMYGTPNLSFFIGGDLYMDFGFPGVLIGGLLCGMLFNYFAGRRINSIYGNNLFEYCMMAALPILVRGPVGAVAALFVCQIVAIFLFSALFTIPRKPAAIARPRSRAVGPLQGAIS